MRDILIIYTNMWACQLKSWLKMASGLVDDQCRTLHSLLFIMRECRTLLSTLMIAPAGPRHGRPLSLLLLEFGVR